MLMEDVSGVTVLLRRALFEINKDVPMRRGGGITEGVSEELGLSG